jgi:predicted DsbA family dithiol-disulfide isomerase
VYQALARKFGGSVEDARQLTGRVSALAAREGLDYDFDRAVMGNTFDAHRLTQLARARGLGEQAHERLLRAHFVEGEALADTETLVRLGGDIGAPEEESRAMLAGDAYAQAVADDLAAAGKLGINAVPFFALDRTYGISGAQPLEVFTTSLRTAHEHAAESTS